MPDPVWLDANVLAQVANGHAALETQSIRLRIGSYQALIAAAANSALPSRHLSSASL